MIKKSANNINQEMTEEEIKIRKRYKLDLIICIISAVIFQLYFVSLHMISLNIFNTYVKISYLVFIIIAVIIFEIAYKKEKNFLIINGIEIILLAIHTMLIGRNISQNITTEEMYILSTSYVWPIYYCFKAIVVYTKENKRKLNKILDVSEIVKEEKPTKKVAKKRKT